MKAFGFLMSRISDVHIKKQHAENAEFELAAIVTKVSSSCLIIVVCKRGYKIKSILSCTLKKIDRNSHNC